MGVWGKGSFGKFWEDIGRYKNVTTYIDMVIRND